MGHFGYCDVDVDGHEFVLTVGHGANGDPTIYAVTDTVESIHYVSEEVDYFSDDLMPTATVPDGNGMPDEIIEVEPRIIESVSQQPEATLSQIGDTVLGPDSRRNSPRDPDSIKAEKKAKTLSWQGLDPENVDEEDYSYAINESDSRKYI